MRNKIKLNYITDSSWWDTDITLIPSLLKSQEIDLNLIVLVPSSDSKYSLSEISEFCLKNKIKHSVYGRSHKIRHISNLAIAFKILKELYQSKSNSSWIFFSYFVDPYLNTLLLLKKKQSIVSFHNYKEHSEQKTAPLESFFKKVFIKKFKYFHFHSLTQKKHFSIDYPFKKVFYTTMPTKDYGTNNHPILRQRDKTELLFFGYIKEYKNLHSLIEAIEILGRDDVRLTIAGNCKNFDRYQKQIKKTDLYNLQIRFIENYEIPDFFMSADFLVLPYNDSTQSGPLLIAMHYNLPIISSDLEPFNSIIKNKVSGILFNTKAQKSMIHAIETACNLTEAQYQDLKNNFKQKVKEYQLEVDANSNRFINFFKANA